MALKKDLSGLGQLLARVRDRVEAYVICISLLWYNLFERRIYCEYLFLSILYVGLCKMQSTWMSPRITEINSPAE